MADSKSQYKITIQNHNTKSQYKTYLGDGVYVDFDGYQLVLTAENGIEAHDRIFLEPSVYRNLEAFWKKLIATKEEAPCERGL